MSRITQSEYVCTGCGFEYNADEQAAVNHVINGGGAVGTIVIKQKDVSCLVRISEKKLSTNRRLMIAETTRDVFDTGQKTPANLTVPVDSLMNETVEITEKSDFTDIFDVLKTAGLDGVAKRIRQLDNLIQNDPAEKPIDIKSLQKFTQFLLKKQRYVKPGNKHKHRRLHTRRMAAGSQRYSSYNFSAIRFGKIYTHR